MFASFGGLREVSCHLRRLHVSSHRVFSLKVRIVRDKYTQLGKGLAFLEFDRFQAAKQVVEAWQTQHRLETA